MQVSFLRVSEKFYNPIIGQYRISNQIFRGTTLSENQKNVFNKAVEEGTGVPNWIYKKLSEDDNNLLRKLMEDKNQKDGGLGSQYQSNYQKAFPPGTVLVPQYQTNKVEAGNNGNKNNG